MKKTFYLSFVFCSLLAYAGKKLPEKVEREQNAEVVEKPSPSHDHSVENKNDSAEVLEKGQQCAVLLSPEKVEREQNAEVVEKPSPSHDHSVENKILENRFLMKPDPVAELKASCVRGDINLFVEPLTSESHLFYPDHATNDFLGKIFSLQADNKSVSMKEMPQSDPLILSLSEDICRNLNFYFPDWKKTIKAKNIPVIAHDCFLLSDADLAPQVIRVIVEKGDVLASEWPQTLQAIKNHNMQVSFVWAECADEDAEDAEDEERSADISSSENSVITEKSDVDSSAIQEIVRVEDIAGKSSAEKRSVEQGMAGENLVEQKIQELFNTGRVSELACGWSAFDFNNPLFNRLMDMAVTVRSFRYENSFGPDFSAPVVLKTLSEKMPSLRKIDLPKPFENDTLNGNGSIEEGYFEHLQDIQITQPCKESYIASYLSLFPRSVKNIRFETIDDLGEPRMSMPQAYFVSKYFKDLYSLEGINLDVSTCPPSFFPETLDELSKNKNLKSFQVSVNHLNNLDVLAEKILLFPRLKKIGLKVLGNHNQFLHSPAVKRLFKSFDSVESLESVALSFPGTSLNHFVLPALALLPKRLSLELSDVRQGDSFGSHRSNSKDLKTIVETNPNALMRVKVCSFIDLKTYLQNIEKMGVMQYF
jgi:hypothetical protein